MKYDFLDNTIDKEHLIFPNSDKINSFLVKNCEKEIIKALDFFTTEEKIMHVHGFMGTGKRQFIDYISEFLSKDVIKLEYYCKASTVCDDIILSFIKNADEHSLLKTVDFNPKITTLETKFHQLLSGTSKPFVVVLHSIDDILPENVNLIRNIIKTILRNDNVKVIISTKAMQAEILSDTDDNIKKIFLKAFTKEIFKEFLLKHFKTLPENNIEDFYKETRGYYYYVALSVKIMQAMSIDVTEFLRKYQNSGMTFDTYLGVTYVNLIPTTIRNFFWFLRVVRHGLSLNALAVFEIYDEFSIEYLKSNLLIFQVDEILYVHDYFLEKIDMMIPQKTEIKLHKYIIGIYEKQLKENLNNRVINISRQAMRAEIEYHNQCIENIKNTVSSQKISDNAEEKKITEMQAQNSCHEVVTIEEKISLAKGYAKEKKYTDAIEIYKKILDEDKIDLTTVVEVRVSLAKLYKEIENYNMASHYYELVETYYIQNKENINLSYLYYDMIDLYYRMYKCERAIKTAKNVIYSVDTPSSLMVCACTRLGNIYSEINDTVQAYNYYSKALESLDENVEDEVLADLYFKYALTNDDRGETDLAFEYYNKCIAVGGKNQYKASAYSNLASCYDENGNLEEAKKCFQKAYDLEKSDNNYEGIYYNALHLAKIYESENSSKTLTLLLEAKSSAEFINENIFIMDASIALGDYYYNSSETYKEALIEYLKAKKIAVAENESEYIVNIDRRIKDMQLRMKKEDFEEIEKKYEN